MNKKIEERVQFGEDIVHAHDRYETLGFGDFQAHAREYLTGERAIPISKTQSINESDITFTFSDNLLQQIVRKDTQLEKAYKVAIKYGLQGHSNGGRNGIFYQKNKDIGMIAATDRLIESYKKELMTDLEIREDGLDALRKVKIVWHNPSGERIVGAYNTNNHRAVFLDLVKY